MIELNVAQVQPIGEMVTVRKPRASATILLANREVGSGDVMPPAELGVIQGVGDGYRGPDGEMVPLDYSPGDVVLLIYGTAAPIPGSPGGYLVPAQSVVAKVQGVTARPLPEDKDRGVGPGEFVLEQSSVTDNGVLAC